MVFNKGVKTIQWREDSLFNTVFFYDDCFLQHLRKLNIQMQ